MGKDKKKVPFAVLRKGAVGLAMAGMMAFTPFIAGCSGTPGERGADGKDGAVWYTGLDVTQFENTGVVGDFFFDTDDCNIYQKTVSGWAPISNIKGKDAVVPEITINQYGYWVIGETTTTVLATGADGDTPEILDGVWWIGDYNTTIRATGANGKSAFDLYKEANPSFTGNIQDWFNSLKGEPGKDGNTWNVGTTYPTNPNTGDMFLNNTTWEVYQYNGTTWESKGNIKGDDGADGANISNQVSAWKGKSAVFVGDSITYGSKCDGDKYWEVLEDKLQLKTVTGMGIGKSCISATNSNGTEFQPLISRYESIPEADLIQIFMGTNDYGFNTPLGTIADTTDVSFYGALNVIIPALQAKYPQSRLVFVTPLHRYGQHGLNYDNDKNEKGYSLSDYVKAIREMCEFYSVPVIDLYNMSGLNPSIEAVREIYMPDGLHPNTKGHEYMANIMANYLELYATSDIDIVDPSQIKSLEEISVERTSPYYPSLTPNCRLSSTYNVYLKAGQTLLLLDSTNYKYFLYPQTKATPTQVSETDRFALMTTWSNTGYTANKSGWYGITMGRADQSQEFDADVVATQTLADYFVIVDNPIKSLEEISVERSSPYFPSSTPNCRLSSTYNVYLKAGQTISLKDADGYKFFLYKQLGATVSELSENQRLEVMNTWAEESFLIEKSGWYGITIGKADHNQEFDANVVATQTLADYFVIE